MAGNMRILSVDDLNFSRVAVPFRSTCGVSQARWVKVGMPQIPKHIIDNVFYLYKSVDDAREGKDPTGTGFVIAYPEKEVFGISSDPRYVFYAITNWHVACDAGASVIRLNTKDGGTDILEFDPADWHFLPGKDDIAALQISLDGNIHSVYAVTIGEFVKDPSQEGHHEYGNVYPGVGEDVFMLGLFVDHAGRGVNLPSARFGNISMLPDKRAPLKQPTGFDGQSFVIDMHSRTGFSGSPVYLYRTFGSDLTQRHGLRIDGIEIDFDHITVSDRYLGGRRGGGHIKGRGGRIDYSPTLRLLGIHWGQFTEDVPLSAQKMKESEEAACGSNGQFVRGLSGMTCVVPAWRILRLLNSEPLKTLRESTFASLADSPPKNPVSE